MSASRRLWTISLGIWLAVVVVGIVIIALLPFPPGKASDQSTSETDTIRLLAYLAWPVFTLVITGLVTATLLGRTPAERPLPADRLRGNPRLAATWVAVTGATVLSLAVLGTVTLSNEEAAEAIGLGGRAVNPGNTGGHPEGTPLEVQVIAQQWLFTYRYPSFGGMETAQLVLPVNTPVTLHITSLDVTHSFWDLPLGVKADAVPQKDNIFSVKPTQIGTYRIQCGELCGLWHGSMSDNTSKVVSDSDFNAWAQQQQQFDAPVMKYLPPYSYTYQPSPGSYGS